MQIYFEKLRNENVVSFFPLIQNTSEVYVTKHLSETFDYIIQIRNRYGEHFDIIFSFPANSHNYYNTILVMMMMARNISIMCFDMLKKNYVRVCGKRYFIKLRPSLLENSRTPSGS